MVPRPSNLGLLRLPEHLRKKMNSPEPLFSPSVSRGTDGLHCIFSPPQDAPFEQKSESESVNESQIITNEFILSPEQPSRQGQIESPFSYTTQSTFESFKTAASIEMFSLTYIERCTSEKTLQQIASHLKDEGNYPSLLWSTEQRLATIRRQFNHSSQSRSFSGLYKQNDLAFAKANPLQSEEDNEISLQMSLSTDFDDDAMSSPVNQIFISNRNAPIELSEKNAQDEVKRLEEMIKKLEIRYSRECNLNETTIRTLNNAFEATEQKSQRMQHEVDAVKKENRELYRLVKDKTEEADKVKANLSGLEKLKHELLSQIHQLKTQLAEAESKALDRTYPRKIHALEQLLQSAQSNIKEIQQERDAMLDGVFHMQGKKAPSNLSKEDRQRIIADFRTNSDSVKLAFDRAMESLSRAEQNATSERHRAKMIKQKSEQQLREASKQIAELEDEVAGFIQRMERMEKSLERSEQRRLKDKNEWEAREKRYKEKLRELNQKPNGVPMSLFKLIKDESEGRKLEIQKLRRKASELESTLLLWDAQAKARMSQTPTSADRAVSNQAFPISQPAPQVNSIVRSHKSTSLKQPRQQLNAQKSLNPHCSSYPPVPMIPMKKELAVQTHSPRDLDGSSQSGVAPSRPSTREHIELVFSGTQVTPLGSKKIKVATIPTRDKAESSAPISSERVAKVSSKKGDLPEVQRKVTGTLDSRTISKSHTNSQHLALGLSSKENQGNKVTFSFPTPDEKKGQTGLNLRLKMVREAGGRKGLLEKLEKIRSPRSVTCTL